MSRLLCPRCQRPQSACICRFAPAVDNEVRLLVLQHPDEQHEVKGTARLLALSLRHCELRVGERFDRPADGLENWLLYPGTDAGRPSQQPAQLRLVLLDGSWRKSRKLLALNPWLQSLPRFNLAPAGASAYALLRKAERAGQLSSLEAAVQALQQTENRPARYGALLAGFEAFVAAQMVRRPTKP
jgi:DTW domain-containing protein YfiP